MKRRAWVATGVGIGISLLLLAGVVRWRGGRPVTAATDYLPQPLEAERGYVGSAACQQCHEDEFAKWHASYHRAMTQRPTPETVQAPFDVTLSRYGWPYHFQRKGDEYWVDMVDPEWEYEQAGPDAYYNATPPRVEKQIVMVTGSHHKQAFWVPNAAQKALIRVPWSYRVDIGRWIPLEADYLSPPAGGARGGLWNDNCIQCHAVAGQPRQHETGFDTRVAELGIACEACHGPGAEHVRFREQPAGPDAAGSSGEPAVARHDPIVNPRSLEPHLGSQVCGQCHITSVIKDYPQFLANGFSYRPGDELQDSMFVLHYTESPAEPWLRAVVSQDPSLLTNRFWKDGTIRVTGREFNGLAASGCYQRGEISCLSCHSMHQYEDVNDQLGEGMHGNQACTQCHGEYRDNVQDHTHHQAGSSGSLCYNCHMPHTTYGLFKAVRAHKIDSPNAASSFRTGRPNACNLCHLDQTLAWTGKALHEWYGQPEVDFPGDYQEVAASLLWLLRGDAAQRAIAAWHMGWQPAREVSGDRWLAPFLAVTLDDPYSAIRNVAGRSLGLLPGFHEFEYDFLADEDARSAAVRRAVEHWSSQQAAPDRSGKAVLLRADGTLDPKVELLQRQRDNREIYIAE